jgi:hypothetical protein
MKEGKNNERRQQKYYYFDSFYAVLVHPSFLVGWMRGKTENVKGSKCLTAKYRGKVQNFALNVNFYWIF